MVDGEFIIKDPYTGRKIMNELNKKNINSSEMDKIFLNEEMI